MKNNSKTQIKQGLKLKNESKEKRIRYMSMPYREGMIVLFTVGLIKNRFLWKVSYFAEPYICNKNKIKVEFDYSNYTRESDL